MSKILIIEDDLVFLDNLLKKRWFVKRQSTLSQKERKTTIFCSFSPGASKKRGCRRAAAGI